MPLKSYFYTKKEFMNIAIFPGSFDPITSGHVDIINRARPLFDKIIVAIGQNTQKKYLFELETRKAWLQKVTDQWDNVDVDVYEGLTVNYTKAIGAKYLIRGLRNASDFDYEKTISQLNNIMGEGLETVFYISHPEFSHVSSTIVREIIKGKGDVGQFVPSVIYEDIKKENY